ncbi:SCO family protein [Ancylobacter defluvii]|uniref:Copper-binding protein n=1 Tax=Ancylobacter defluvii TaxID=1282440 RepID=A0A9W6NB04_9HYPH|nr:SCO family protein [Ancylobacter defluvii]MBS7589427.1 SCO family protein [Ancylobacter defluvii]GLK85044.1 copper-binding protein [Ancylobacter defluvii]
MPARRRLLLLLSAFLVGAAVVAVSVFALLPSTRPVATQASVGGPFTLVDQDGQTVNQESFKGAPTLVFFGFTHCPDICPTTLFEMSQLFEYLGEDARKVQGLFITVDPERDTPEVMKSYIGSFHPSIQALTGTPEQVAATIKAYRAYAQKVPGQNGDYTMNHTAIVYLMDKDGNFVAPFDLKRPPAEAAKVLRPYF